MKQVTDGHPKRITNSGQTQLKIDHCAPKTMNICRNFVFRIILSEVRPVGLREETFPALGFDRVGGFHKNWNFL